MTNTTNPTIILGGGFVGLFTALHLCHHKYKNPIILIDNQTRFVFKPLLYELLTGEMQAEQVAPTYEELLQGSDVVFVRDTVSQINLQQRSISLANGLNYTYGNLVLALGSIQGYFNTKGAEECAFSFRTYADVRRLKQHLHSCLQQATQITDVTQRQALLTVAVVGAGPAGVEMAATLGDLLPDWYAKLGGDIQEIRIVLLSHGDQILSGDINAHLQETALKALTDRVIPIELVLNASVESISSEGLHYKPKQGNSQGLPSSTTIWTAGTATHPLISTLPLPDEACDKHRRPLVSETLQIPSHPEVFAAGDCAIVQAHPLPPVAQIAYQQGAGIAKNLVSLSLGQSPQSVEAKMRGTLLKLGIHHGVANLFDKFQVTGEAGDLIRNGTYLEMLPTPIHNFKATVDWLTDEIFERHRLPESPSHATPAEHNSVFKWVLRLGIPALLIAGVAYGVRSYLPIQLPPTEQQPSPK